MERTSRSSALAAHWLSRGGACGMARPGAPAGGRGGAPGDRGRLVLRLRRDGLALLGWGRAVPKGGGRAAPKGEGRPGCPGTALPCCRASPSGLCAGQRYEPGRCYRMTVLPSRSPSRLPLSTEMSPLPSPLPSKLPVTVVTVVLEPPWDLPQAFRVSRASSSSAVSSSRSWIVTVDMVPPSGTMARARRPSGLPATPGPPGISVAPGHGPDVRFIAYELYGHNRTISPWDESRLRTHNRSRRGDE